MSRIMLKPSIDEVLEEYLKLREQTKLIKSRMDELANEIKSYAEKNGVKDDKGSYYCDNGTYLYGKTAKKSVSFDKEKAISFFEKKGLSDAVKIVKEINEDAVEKYISESKISYDDLEKITTTKVTYAVQLQKKEDMPTVEQSTVKSAASKRPKLSAKRGK